MMYAKPIRRRWPRRVLLVALFVILGLVLATAVVRAVYKRNLEPYSSSQQTVLVNIASGATVEQIGVELEQKHLIRSSWAFKLYVSSKEARSSLKAGEYELQPRMTVAEIVAVLTHGKVATNLVTIIPGKRIDQIKARLLQDGFAESDVDIALNPATYAGNPALVDKPDTASLEGYIYPDSYQKTSDTSATNIISAALLQMREKLTPDLRNQFGKQGLSAYQAIILASIVEKEVPSSVDRAQVAQVFLKRLRMNMALQSDATKHYFDSYHTVGLPPTPISNVTLSSLQAVANPASTDWLYFVSGDDGTTHFASTLADQEAHISQYCHRLCAQ